MVRKHPKGSVPASLAEVVAKSFFRFTDDQWRQIERLSGLPSKAREDVETRVGLFRHCQAVTATRPSQAELRQELGDLHRDAVRLQKRLEELSPWAKQIFWSPDELMPDWEDPRLSKTKPPRLKAAISAVTQLVRWFQFATPQARRQPGPNPENVRDLVNELDEILARYTGRHITRSYKSTAADYVTAICKIADPTLGAGTIEAAMKGCISARKSDTRFAEMLDAAMKD